MTVAGARSHHFPALPAHGTGQTIGILGGSFNPPHAGHLHISLQALQRLRLDFVWWLVSPGNPLKDTDALASTEERARLACGQAMHPRIRVSTIEAAIGERYTVETLRYLRARAPELQLVWLMGADGLASFHRWRGWMDIAGLAPFAVIDRPGWTLRALASPAAQRLARHRLDERGASKLARQDPPAWIFLFGPRSHLSSTQLRSGTQPDP